MKKQTIKKIAIANAILFCSFASQNASAQWSWSGSGPVSQAAGATDVNIAADLLEHGNIYGDHGIYTLTSRVYSDAKVDHDINIGNNANIGATLYTVDNYTYRNAYIDGYLRIGNSVGLPAGYKLYVQQGILTEKVKVAVANTANWSDFVFAKDYKLQSLSDVENYISNNQHLPGIPSAKEVVNDGVDVATMDAKLLQKIEELTLYVIQQQKEIDKLKAARN